MDEFETRHDSSVRPAVARRLPRLLGPVLGIVLAGLFSGLGIAQAALSPQQTRYLQRAQQGVNEAWSAGGKPTWGDHKWDWYNRLLTGNTRNPLAEIWDVVGLWESENDIALAKPTSKNVHRVEYFAEHAWTYRDKNITPVLGETSPRVLAYGPYPGNYNDPETFCDDNAWWALAFLNAREVMLLVHLDHLANVYLQHALVGFDFISKYCWDAADGGGMYWSTAHKQRSGEALGLATDLAARLFQATSTTAARDAAASRYLADAESWITWANYHLLKWDGSYACGYVKPGSRSCAVDRLKAKLPEVIMPHDGEGAMISAFTTLCETGAKVPASVYQKLPPNKTHGVNPSFRLPYDPSTQQPLSPSSWCSWAESLANSTAHGVNPGSHVQDAFLPLNEGPQWDATYVRGLLTLYSHDHNPEWYRAATGTAARIIKNARESNGLYLKGWDGSTHILDAVPGMLRTHAWSVSVFAALADVAPPA
jgi:hypothetical protein